MVSVRLPDAETRALTSSEEKLCGESGGFPEASFHTMSRHYEQLRHEAERIAGANKDLAQRAAVYHYLYRHSGGNHVFPLIAAHGALWAGGYFRFGLRLGDWVARWRFRDRSVRERKLKMLSNFADAFRNVNRLVCIETYVTYFFTMRYGHHKDAAHWIPSHLLTQLNQVHHARETQIKLSQGQMRDVYETFFLNEQVTVVGPKVQAAAKELDWPLLRRIALMPHVRMAFMPGLGLQFTQFCDQKQRVRNGLKAIDQAFRVGLPQVEKTLNDYGVLPSDYSEALDKMSSQPANMS